LGRRDADGCQVTSDGLACFGGVTDAGYRHDVLVVGARKPKDLPEFTWVNALLGNLKTSVGGADHAVDFAKYGARYLSAVANRFNRRLPLDRLPSRLRVAAILRQDLY
jgi:hypothetical protein